jgi:membrane protein YqaA with SNARE-associated domain
VGGFVSYLDRLSRYLLLLGIPGLFAIALLDSAAIPMVGGPDGIVILLAWRNPAQMLWIALSAATGSTAGCWILYRIARLGGEAALARTRPKLQAWVKQRVERNGFGAVFLAVIAPPPFPTKPVILAAGMFRIPLISFLMAAFWGRLLRYLVMAYLGSRFGDHAAQIIRSHFLIVLLVLAGIVLLVLLLRRIFRSAPPCISGDGR